MRHPGADQAGTLLSPIGRECSAGPRLTTAWSPAISFLVLGRRAPVIIILPHRAFCQLPRRVGKHGRFSEKTRALSSLPGIQSATSEQTPPLSLRQFWIKNALFSSGLIWSHESCSGRGAAYAFQENVDPTTSAFLPHTQLHPAGHLLRYGETDPYHPQRMGKTFYGDRRHESASRSASGICGP